MDRRFAKTLSKQANHLSQSNKHEVAEKLQNMRYSTHSREKTRGYIEVLSIKAKKKQKLVNLWVEEYILEEQPKECIEPPRTALVGFR